jgi:hypothetical protein
MDAMNGVTVSSEAMPANNSQPDMGNPHPNLAKTLIRMLDIGSSLYNFATWEGYAAQSGGRVLPSRPRNGSVPGHAGR